MFTRTVAVLCRFLCLWIAAGVVGIAPAQNAKTFDVAYIKPAPPDANPQDGYWSPPTSPRFIAHHLTFIRLVQLAYGLNRSEVDGVSPWMEQLLFDVDATTDSGVLMDADEMQPRLQCLLAERFGLATHRQNRILAGYALVKAADPTKLTAPPPDAKLNQRHAVSAGHIDIPNCTMAFFARQLGAVEGLPIADRTSLLGSYQVKLLYAPALAQESQFAPLLTAIQEQMGLKLVSEKLPINILIMDRANRMPTPN